MQNLHRESVTLDSTDFRIELTFGDGLECSITHRPSGEKIADGPYSYSFGEPTFHLASQTENVVLLEGKTIHGIEVAHEFSVSDHGWFEEQITTTNTTAESMRFKDIRCGFTRRSEPDLESRTETFTAIPFRREPAGIIGQYMDFTLDEVLHSPSSSRLLERVVFWTQPTISTPEYSSEAWWWDSRSGGFVISKYSDNGMEWSLLDSTNLEDGGLRLRWGGIGLHHGQPERGATLAAGESHTWGVTRVTAVSGGLEEAYYAFRSERTSRGHGCPQDFNPPVHWNELYDNKLYTLPNNKQDEAESRALYYTRADMMEEARKGQLYSCEALYLDPGWDTHFASKIWDSARLGPAADFIDTIKNDYGLKVSVHAPMAGWTNPTSYPETTWRKNRWGQRARWDASNAYRFFNSPICGASEEFRNETYRRLTKLTDAGIAFIMFDGTMFVDECWDSEHGHPVPAGRQAHAESHLELARMVHDSAPDVLIEMHDPVVGGFPSHFTPIYYGHGRESKTGRRGFDSVWAFELMWRPLDDLLSGHAIALYYYNLAYSLPLYEHVDLKSDNEHCLVLWWNVSTSRHLGIGGTSADPAIVTSQQAAMREYIRLKPYFTHGEFFGLGEETHAHTAQDGRSTVMNCFNLSDEPLSRTLDFRLDAVGLRPDLKYQAHGADLTFADGVANGELTIPARGHALIEISSI